ncbi:MAG: hypothetical protein QOH60_2980 [Mycobacterium sp.]|jgi:hypothetical protein|nr:hypothetical protein [Mycobacterium sp.]
MKRVIAALCVGVALVAALALSACGSRDLSVPAVGESSTKSGEPESSQVGDIPDTQVYVPFSSSTGLFTVSVPEGWAQSAQGAATVFTDKLNTVRIELQIASVAPTPESAQRDEVPAIQSSTGGYQFGPVRIVQRKAGEAVMITYQATSGPNAVTGKVGVDAVERYEFWRDGHEVILTLSGPLGADNVDPWRTITDSLQWQ